MPSSDHDKICLYMTTTETEFLSVAEAASLLNLSEQTIYRRVWDGSLPALRLSENGAIRIPRAALRPGEEKVGASPGPPVHSAAGGPGRRGSV